jgi:hypothetical protein
VIAIVSTIYAFAVITTYNKAELKSLDDILDIFKIIWKKTLFVPALTYILSVLWLVFTINNISAAYGASIAFSLIVSQWLNLELQLILIIALRRTERRKEVNDRVFRYRTLLKFQLKEGLIFLAIFWPTCLVLSAVFRLILLGHI